MDFIIRKAEMADMGNVEKLYENVLDYEEKNVSYTNWKKGLYPTRGYAEKAIISGTLYVGVENDEIMGSVILNQIQSEEYSRVHWKFQAEASEIMVIHTLCIAPGFTKQGFGKKFIDFSEQAAKASGCKIVRLDTYEGNIPAASLYSKLGYRYAGNVEALFQNFIPETLKFFEKALC